MTGRSLIFAASRWGFSSRRRMSLTRTVLAGAGIAAGVTALIVVLGIMNGLQEGYIKSILEISSFHLRVEVPEGYAADDASLEALRAVPGVSSVDAFKETHMLALGPSGQTMTLQVRAFKNGTERSDPALVRALGLRVGDRLPLPGELVLGKEAAARLGADPGSRIQLFGMRQTADEGVVPVSAEAKVGAVFDSGYYEFDSSMCFASLDESSPELSAAFSPIKPVLGIKLANRYADYRTGKAIKARLPEGAGQLLSWRDYNRSFFGALRTEKSMMMLLVSLIFVVVGINVFHAMRRAIASKMIDIAVLKACGATDRDIRTIFVADGASIGATGALAGTALGLLLCAHVDEVMDAVSSALRFAASLPALLGMRAAGGDYRLFSPAYYYIDKIPVSLSAAEVFFIALTAIASTGVAAAIAARKVSEAKPSEVFRNE